MLSRVEIGSGGLERISLFGMNIPFIEAKEVVAWNTIYLMLLMFVCPDLPVPFLGMIDKKRAGLIFARPVSRRAFLPANLLGVFLYLWLFSAVSIVTVGLALTLRLQEVPIEFISSVCLFPLLAFFGFYLLSILFGLISHSYSLSIIGPILCGYFSLLLYRQESVLSSLDMLNETAQSIATAIYYIIPRITELSLLTFGFLRADEVELTEVLLSFLLPLVLAFAIISQKEF